MPVPTDPYEGTGTVIRLFNIVYQADRKAGTQLHNLAFHKPLDAFQKCRDEIFILASQTIKEP